VALSVPPVEPPEEVDDEADLPPPEQALRQNKAIAAAKPKRRQNGMGFSLNFGGMDQKRPYDIYH
jgi:hypothetical protein